MYAPKRIFLELNNVPPCNFGALWYDAEAHDPASENCVPYVLESEAQAEIELLKSRIAGLEQTINELSLDLQQANVRIERDQSGRSGLRPYENKTCEVPQ